MRIIYVSISTQERCKKILSVLSWSLLLCWKSPDGGIKVLWSSFWLPFLGKDHRFWLHYRDCRHTWCIHIKIRSGCEATSAFVFLLAAVACYWLHGQHVTWALIGMTCKLAAYWAGDSITCCIMHVKFNIIEFIFSLSISRNSMHFRGRARNVQGECIYCAG